MSNRKLPVLLLLAAVLLTTALPALAERPDPAEARSLVLYPRGLAEVSETRIIPVAEGEQTLALPMISPRLMPGSIRLEVEKPRGVETLSLGFSERLLDLAAWWGERVGERIQVAAGDSSVEGVLRRVTGDHLFLDMAGKLVPVSRSEAEEGLTLDALPPGMVTEPSLLWTLDAPRAGSVTVRLSYLSEGFELEGDHRMVLDEDDAVLSGGFVVANQTGLTLPYDKLTLVAGAIHLAGDRRRVDRLNPSPGAAKGGEVSRFGDLHRWTVPTSGVLPTGASVAVPVIEAVSGKAERFYEYDATIFDERVTSKLTVPYQVPVPSGNVRLYEKRGGDLLFTASDRVDDTPAGSPMELTIAQVFDITAERTRIHEAPREEGGTVQRMEVVLGNSFDRDVEVRVLERLFGDWEVSWAKLEGEELEAERVDARTARFDVSIPEGETVTLRYEILYER